MSSGKKVSGEKKGSRRKNKGAADKIKKRKRREEIDVPLKAPYTIKTNFLRYLGLCNAIPASCTETLICGVDNCEMNLLPSQGHGNLGNWTCQYTYARSF